MVKKHLKRLWTPKTWAIKKKGIKYVIRPYPGPHSIENSIPLGVLLRDILHYAKTAKEAKLILNNKEVKVDGIRRKDIKFPVGLFDVIELSKKHFRLTFNQKGNLIATPALKEDVALKPCKIIGKRKLKGKFQLNLFDGKNILIDKADYKPNDTLLISIPKQEIKKHIKLEKGASIYLIGGKKIGSIGTLEDIQEENISYKDDSGNMVETLKKYAIAIGKGKPEIKLSE